MSLRSAVLAACCAIALVGGVQAAAEDLDRVQRLQREGGSATALVEAERHLAQEPRDAQMRFLRANLLADASRVLEAIDELQRLAQEFPSLPEPHNNLATLYAARGEYDKARASLEEALRLQPSYATAHENLGDVHAALAAQAYATAQRLDPARTGLQAKLALVRQLTSATSLSSPAASAAK